MLVVAESTCPSSPPRKPRLDCLANRPILQSAALTLARKYRPYYFHLACRRSQRDDSNVGMHTACQIPLSSARTRAGRWCSPIRVPGTTLRLPLGKVLDFCCCILTTAHDTECLAPAVTNHAQNAPEGKNNEVNATHAPGGECPGTVICLQSI